MGARRQFAKVLCVTMMASAVAMCFMGVSGAQCRERLWPGPLPLRSITRDAKGRIIEWHLKSLDELAADYASSCGLRVSADIVKSADKQTLKAIVLRGFGKSDLPLRLTPEFAETDLALYRLIASGDINDAKLLFSLLPVAPPYWLHRVYHETLSVISAILVKSPDTYTPEELRSVAQEHIHALTEITRQQPWENLRLPLRHVSPGLGVDVGTHLVSGTQSFLLSMVDRKVLDRNTVMSMIEAKIAEVREPVPNYYLKQLRYRLGGVAAPPELPLPTPVPVFQDDPRYFSPVIKDPTLNEAVNRQATIATLLSLHASERGYYPQTLDELIPYFNSIREKRTPNTLFADPMRSDGGRFYYESDGTSFLLKSTADLNLDARLTLTRIPRANFTFTPAEVEENKKEYDVRPKGIVRRTLPPSPPQHIFDRMQVLRTAARAYKEDFGRYPQDLAPIFTTDKKYLLRIGSEPEQTYAQEAFRDGRMKSPDGYDWYYECTADGQHFMLGLYRISDASKAIDPLMPVLSTKLPEGNQWAVPGANTEEAIAQFHAK